jgi:adenine-specific DNA methylase
LFGKKYVQRKNRNLVLSDSIDNASGAQLPLKLGMDTTVRVLTNAVEQRAIETSDFPFEVISAIAESESWRKEINRPLSHIHKWWAQRLGSIFRAVAIGALAPAGSDVMKLFHSRVRFPEASIFDPFMGSGTTVIEALKLGARAIGRDINPVAHFLVKNAVAIHKREEVLEAFKRIEKNVASRILDYYRARMPDGTEVPVLYYFWVKQVACPECQEQVDLFSSRIFARHAYPKRFPEAHAVCPNCSAVDCVRFDAKEAICGSCHTKYNPSEGAARGQHATCHHCSHRFSISKTVKALAEPPQHRMYAKLVLLPNGQKRYLPADEFDRSLFAAANQELSLLDGPYPVAAIEPGQNTNQALNYNYKKWHQFFNARQLLCLSFLVDEIQKIGEPALKELFTCLFSGALEFNNMFASYKGEGTGAVRHMFSHHILKPERTPLEANLWGTRKSSGSFSTMFETRILRALDYAENPFELKLVTPQGDKTEKIYGYSDSIGYDCAATAQEFAQGKQVYVSCGNSGKTDISDQSVDVVLTDPPFFDNVHYSQLADFFHVWQRHILGVESTRASETTRAADEVQHGDRDIFCERLSSVLKESNRVLKNDGLLVFSYHHSRTEGWWSVLKAVMDAEFVIVAVHPVKAEMSLAMPKHQAVEPIDLDIMVVCRKRISAEFELSRAPLEGVTIDAKSQIDRLRNSGRKLSRNDVRIILMSNLLKSLSAANDTETALNLLEDDAAKIESVIDSLHFGAPPESQN